MLPNKLRKIVAPVVVGTVLASTCTFAVAGEKQEKLPKGSLLQLVVHELEKKKEFYEKQIVYPRLIVDRKSTVDRGLLRSMVQGCVQEPNKCIAVVKKVCALLNNARVASRYEAVQVYLEIARALDIGGYPDKAYEAMLKALEYQKSGDVYRMAILYADRCGRGLEARLDYLSWLVSRKDYPDAIKLILYLVKNYPDRYVLTRCAAALRAFREDKLADMVMQLADKTSESAVMSVAGKTLEKVVYSNTRGTAKSHRKHGEVNGGVKGNSKANSGDNNEIDFSDPEVIIFKEFSGD